MIDENSEHWEGVYRSKDAQAVSWFREHLEVSLQLLENAGLNVSSRLIDVGGGASTLVDDLLTRGVRRITVLDLSSQALDVARRRLGERATTVEWLIADIMHTTLPSASFDLWHDRAVLHFLIAEADIAAYVKIATRALRPDGHVVVGGFGSDGPTMCSGLPVARREASDIAELFGAAFELVEQAKEQHRTPWGLTQSFAYAVLRKRA